MLTKLADAATLVGVLFTDMNVPGCLISHINARYTEVFGFAPAEAVGKKPGHLIQGPETEEYLVDEIVDALRQAEPLCVKLHNYTKAGRKLQNLLCLQPIFGLHGEYLYQVGTFVEFTPDDPLLEDRLAEAERFLSLLPRATGGDGAVADHLHGQRGRVAAPLGRRDRGAAVGRGRRRLGREGPRGRRRRERVGRAQARRPPGLARQNSITTQAHGLDQDRAAERGHRDRRQDGQGQGQGPVRPQVRQARAGRARRVQPRAVADGRDGLAPVAAAHAVVPRRVRATSSRRSTRTRSCSCGATSTRSR